MSESARLTRKRAREQEDSTANDDSPLRKRSDSAALDDVARDRPAYKKDEEFWFGDGTVILIARDVEFRVYSGVLATHSPIFRDKFCEDNPIRNVSINGKSDVPCPVVMLTDSPEDLRHILRAYMLPSDTSMFISKQPSFAMISAFIRLGKKYQFISLYEQSLDFLKGFYPNRLEAWRKLTDWVPTGWDLSESIGVVNLARLSGELSLLPTAFLSCLILTSIVHGFTREDGSPENLSLEDLNICFNAKTEIRKASIKVLYTTLAARTTPECKTQTACRRAFRTALSSLRACIDDLMDTDPFLPYTSYVKDGKLGVCSACRVATNEKCWNGRLALWNRLPTIIGIDVPGWGEPVAAAAG
ncbi:hypothetical protein L226DRAFT_466457 [Lentinus tigrinus ALCF2SS1-7]|uniref:BTB domain-containing protein n=1 Tax=Lentinus tigrinus ALCF2SS1-6 TaxID=1328759 RepID=A0A5C2S4M7_9APHY|nr:hypothetical protein L227DRAFT_594227 [Lentinus tigrinus ALCF2SS1-6]RPD72820.1 hypothetical protein L226DRAFT_466457 [Lentinus tigrinus ALCF2SS1-7]